MPSCRTSHDSLSLCPHRACEIPSLTSPKYRATSLSDTGRKNRHCVVLNNNCVHQRDLTLRLPRFDSHPDTSPFQPIAQEKRLLILEIVIFSAALIAVGLLAVQQIIAQVREYNFYKKNGGDFSVDSNMDHVKLDRSMHYNDLRLTNWQRFYLFRPACIAMLVFVWAMMVVSSL